MKLIAPDSEVLKGKILLPASKSICNRALIIQALSSQEITLDNISKSIDTQILKRLFISNEKTLNCEMAGTTFRFLTAYFAQSNKELVLTGSPRMLERPIAKLVDGLRTLGADIEYVEKENFPPLRIKGNALEGKKINLPANVSSQFVSAIMLIAPMLKSPTEITLQSKIVSKPYIEMTAKVMQHFGAAVAILDDKINIEPIPYQKNNLFIEGDWSSAAFYYSLVALSEEAKLELSPLFDNSWQGDKVVEAIFYRLGVITSPTENGILLEKGKHIIDFLEYDFIDCPDLAQVVMTTCVGLNIEGKFTGLETLHSKETDRIKAMQTELAKFGWKLEKDNEFYLLSKDYNNKSLPKINISTYNDHRMAMAFAPLVLLHQELEIENPNVVKKSNPDFWAHLEELGFRLEY